MAKKFSDMSSKINSANPATVAAAIGGGVNAGEVNALRKLLDILALRPDLAHPILKLADDVNLNHG